MAVQNLARLFALPVGRSLAVLFRPQRAADWTLVRLAERAVSPSRLTILTTANGAERLRDMTSSTVQIAPARSRDDEVALRWAARWAVTQGVRDLAVGDTRISNALSAITRLDGGVFDTWMGGPGTGLEALPQGTLKLHTPLVRIDEAAVDAGVPPAVWNATDAPPREVDLASRLLGDNGPSVDALLRHASRRAAAARFLCAESDALLRTAVLEASHWGYIVVRRSSLLEAYASGRGGCHVATHAMCRLVGHVSGASTVSDADDENIGRLLDAIMQTDSLGLLKPLPKGRTVAGVVVRPATGRFAKRVLQVERRYMTRRPASRFREHPDDLMILTREPDHESGSLLSLRLKNNRACSPISPDGAGVFWDNRFVVATAPASQLDHSDGPIVTRDVLVAVLGREDDDEDNDVDNNDGKAAARLIESEFYVRQLRRNDWEKITAITNRVREFQIPYECIRALPVVFQKESGSKSPGQLIASPHLGISARPDLYFTAVRMPRFRILPPDLDPGFREDHLDEMHGAPPTRMKSPARHRSAVVPFYL